MQGSHAEAGLAKKLFGDCAISKSVKQFGKHGVQHWEVSAGKSPDALAEVRARLPGHYRSPVQIQADLGRLGAAKTSAALQLKLPTRPNARSGDLGEMLAVEFIEEQHQFQVPLRKLRYRDDRNLALRGDDVLGFRVNQKGVLEALKTEAKSTKKLTATTIKAAVTGLESDGGRPKYHAAFFVSDRLRESDDPVKVKLGEQIHDELVGRKLPVSRTFQLLFAVRGGGKDDCVEAAVNTLPLKAPYRTVCVVTLPDHQGFIAEVFKGPFKFA